MAPTCLMCFQQLSSPFKFSEDKLKQFVKQFESYLNEESLNYEGNQLVDKLINEKVMSVCGNCFKIMEGFGNLFREKQAIEVKLNEKVFEVEKIFNEAHLRHLIDSNWGDIHEERLLMEWKERLAKECLEKRLKSSSRIYPEVSPDNPIVLIEPTTLPSLASAVMIPAPVDHEAPPVASSSETGRQLRVHSKIEHKNVQNVCENCGKVFKARGDLKRHRLARVCYPKDGEDESYPFSCNICQRKFRYRDGLRVHKRIVHEGIRYQCGYCSVVKTRTTEVNKHIKITHNDPTGAPLPSKIIKIVKRDYGANPQAEESKCGNCGKVFKERRQLRRHHHVRTCFSKEGREDTQSRFACNLCPKRFRGRMSLTHHKRMVHEGIRYQCGYCEFLKTSRRTLKHHIQLVHQDPATGEALPWKAKVVKIGTNETSADIEDGNEEIEVPMNETELGSQGIQVFTTPAVSLSLSRIRTPRQVSSQIGVNSPGFPCDVCGKVFTDKYGRYTHKRNFHEGIKYKCGYCSSICNYKTDINRHIKRTHGHVPFKSITVKVIDVNGDTSYSEVPDEPMPKENDEQKSSCHFCNAKFSFNSSLRRHIRSQHEGVRYQCGYCHMVTTGVENLRNHSLKSHKEASTGVALPLNYTVVNKTNPDESETSRDNFEDSVTSSEPDADLKPLIADFCEVIVKEEVEGLKEEEIQEDLEPNIEMNVFPEEKVFSQE